MQYKIHRHEISKIPIKTTLTLYIVVSGDWTKPAIDELLNDLCRESEKNLGLHSDSKNRHIFIYIYTSEDRADAGQDSWVAMLKKIGINGKIHKSFDDNGINNINIPEETRLGLTEQQRRDVWEKLVLSERSATKEADSKYPLDPSLSEQTGQSFILNKQIPLVPYPEINNSMERLEGVIEETISLPCGTHISVIEVRKDEIKNWYLVEAKTEQGDFIGKGWINGIALIGQKTYMSSTAQLDHENIRRRFQCFSDERICSEYGLSQEQLQSIAIEGLKKKWPFPNSD